MELPIHEVAFVIASFEFEAALASFFAFYEFASKLYFVVIPRLSTITMLLVILPLAFIHGAVCVDEYDQAISFPVNPFSLVNISICMCHTAFAIELLVFGHSLIC